MDPWIISAIPGMFIGLIFSVVPITVMMLILYFVIKLAVKNALRE